MLHPNSTTELFRIVEVRISKPTTYILDYMNGLPIAGTFYEYESHPDIYLVERITAEEMIT